MSDSSRYAIPARIHRIEETIRRSRFITTAAHAPDADDALAFVERIREEFPDATHNCWAFVAGPPGSMTHIGMSDDGEPVRESMVGYTAPRFGRARPHHHEGEHVG